MSNLFAAAQQSTARTANGAVTNYSTDNPVLDLFGVIGSSRGKDLTGLFGKAFYTDEERAVRVLLWARDVRGGAGERQQFRDLLKVLINKKPDFAKRVLTKIPELGRFDDLLVAIDTPVQSTATSIIEKHLLERNGLCAKWMPRKGATAAKLRRALNLTAREYRKLLVELTQEANVVEQLMCSGNWDEIEYGKIPSLAAARYQKAFERNDPSGYNQYISKLEAGEEKINASAVYPYDIVKSSKTGNERVAEKQWESLPDYINGAQSILPMVDVSGSMSWCNATPSLTCMDIAISLGLYCTERQTGSFKNKAMTFTDIPKFIDIPAMGSLRQRLNAFMKRVGYSTNFVKAFGEILRVAQSNNLPQSDMPDIVLALSDMEFNSCGGSTNFTAIKRKYENAGYEMPKLVFWNLNAREGNNPIKAYDDNVALVSGFSPAIMEAVLGAKDFNPNAIMDEAIMKERYNF